MKTLRTPTENLELVFTYMAKVYAELEEKTEGEVQFHLTHEGKTINYYLQVDKNEMTINEGTTDNPSVTLNTKLSHWLDLAAGTLNPILGVMTGRLKFKGDTSFFKKISPGRTIDISDYEDPVMEFEKAPTKHWMKPTRILVINGSPRGENGYTYFYLSPFIEGLREAGSEVEFVNLKGKDIRQCRGCWHCWISGTGECIHKDDLVELNEKRDSCDMLVIAFPLYVDGIPSSLKNYLERGTRENYPYMIEGIYKTRHPRRNHKDRSLVLFSTCGFPEIEHFNAVRTHFKAWSHNSHMPLVAEILRPEGMNLCNSPVLYFKLLSVMNALKESGMQLAQKGFVDKKTMRTISQPACDTKEFRNGSNMFWHDIINSGQYTY